MTNKIKEAGDFFKTAHESIGQKRNYTGEPYGVHLDETAEIIWGVTHDEDITIAAYGHDLLEDVTIKNPKYSKELIESLFGSRVLQLIIEVTDVFTKRSYPDLNRAKRHHKEVERLSKISADGKTIKLADMISNCKDVVDSDPEFAKVYLAEKLFLLPHLKDGNSILFDKAVELVKKETVRLYNKV
jgi:(p)ppGpp synthase/HD superfamily hydrolase